MTVNKTVRFTERYFQRGNERNMDVVKFKMDVVNFTIIVCQMTHLQRDETHWSETLYDLWIDDNGDDQ